MASSLLALEEQPVQLFPVDEACRRIAPFWPLQHFVAVNPFLGLSEMPFADAAQLLEKVTHGAPIMDVEYYLAQIRGGLIDAADITAALAGLGSTVQPSDPVSWLMAELAKSESAEHILTVADSLDRNRGTNWGAFVVDEISKWCASYFDRGQSPWKFPWSDVPLYTAWKHAAEIDLNPEVFGLAGFRKHARELPGSADAAIEHALNLLEVPPEFASDFLHRELMSVAGWSAFAVYQDRPTGVHDVVRQLLAIRLAYDTALLSLDRNWRFQVIRAGTSAGFSQAKYVAQIAAEHAFRVRLADKLRTVRPHPSTGRKTLQAVFCIDVRSEAYRRALEAQSPDIQTIGFAGFFGMPLDVASSARCPVLIKPGPRVDAQQRGGELDRLRSQVATVWKTLVSSASACFSSVEVGGAWFGVRLLQQTTRASRTLDPAPKLSWNISLKEQVDLAAAALKNMSIDTCTLARVVLFCGHGSSSENNPYASSLDCGACGGHKGDTNARFAAALMNDPIVRRGLKAQGIAIPEDTVFVAGLHITTTDDVILYDTEALTEHQLKQIEGWLKAASLRTRRERNGVSMSSHQAGLSGELDREIRRRAADWSEVRPEWGLAGNAAFIAAPRSRTLDLDLGGRVFLHEYDSAADEDSSVLELILTAPVVVASWINLQYYGSTVNNRLFGSGNKVLHNVVGAFGVWEGNGGDLRTGLPLQSLHDGTKWVHEPLRLQVFVDATRERIDRVLERNSSIRMLVENQWIYLMSMEGTSIYERRGISDWQII
jgi:uncharacterized protein YbcC (UPF0753/DUF2309 family)